MMEELSLIANVTMTGLDWVSTAFILAIGILFLVVVVLFIIDVTQTADAVRRNYPVIGRFRYVFMTLGEFFRQYFFAMDREELPFNRAEREWIHRAAKDRGNTIAFGSTKNLTPANTAIFVNCPFPTLDEDAVETQPLQIGPYCQTPYEAPSFFNISGMSFGALSAPAVRALSRGAKLAGCWLNTGEGGLSPFHLEGGCDIVFQIGTAKYGVRGEDGALSDDRLKEVASHEQVRMFEIKLSQGAKPGKGGILPASKVTAEIAKTRGIPEGEASISPNRHPEINSVDDLLAMINRIRDVTGKPVGIKFVVGAYGWLEELCAEINKRGAECAPDFVTVDSGDGGTGAAPMPLMDNVGLLAKESLPMVAGILQKFGLRECNRNTCPTGITTHNPRLQRGLNLADKAVRVANYHKNLTHEVEIIAHSCGVPEPRRLKRFHVRIVQADGRSVAMDDLYPWPEGPGGPGEKAA